MDNYTFDGTFYIANEGYIFRHKEKGMPCKSFMKTSFNSVDDYDCIEKSIEEEIPEEPIEEIDYETAYNELTEVIDNV